MEDILGQIGSTVGGVFGSPLVQIGLRLIGIYLIVIWLATAYWAFRDMQQRSDNVILPYLAAAGIILFTPIFFILAVWVYKIIRPHEKIGEVWERNLAEEALLAEVESIHHCPGCDRTHQRRVDHLPELPDAAQPGLPQLQPPRRDGLVAVRLVRQGLRATRGGRGGRPRADHQPA